MEEKKTKVSYEQIEKANKDIELMDIKGGSYAKVNERTKAYRKVYPTGTIKTDIVEQGEDFVKTQTIVTDESDRVIATGMASEKIRQGNGFDINKDNLLENCETSSVGRALGFAGFGIDKEIASGEDIAKVSYTKPYQISSKIYISDNQAKEIVILTIKDLIRKVGARLSEVEEKIQERIWCSLSECTVNQLLNIEVILRTVNNENSEWHNLYGTNSKLKEIVPKNQEINYVSSHYQFGMLALQKVGTDAVSRSEIIDEYINMGINLES